MAKEPGISTARQGELIRGVLQILIDHSEGLRGRVVMERLQQLVPFSDYELG